MISQSANTKKLEGLCLPKEKGFFVEGKNFDDCIAQLTEWGNAHPEKWIYYYNIGVAPAKSCPVARNYLEVHICDAKPAGIMMMKLFQEGCDGLTEWDTMTEKEKIEMRKKHLNFYANLGAAYIAASQN